MREGVAREKAGPKERDRILRTYEPRKDVMLRVEL